MLSESQVWESRSRRGLIESLISKHRWIVIHRKIFIRVVDVYCIKINRWGRPVGVIVRYFVVGVVCEKVKIHFREVISG